VRPIPLLLAISLLGGCASIDAARNLAAAEVALEGARAAGAEKQATYEYVSADANYQKAREENARARYRDAIDHARAAAKLAEEARAKALGTGPRQEEK
jgi:outer membrane translocation and assembly module TamA